MNVKERLANDGLLAKVAVGSATEALLSSMEIQPDPAPHGSADSADGEGGAVKFQHNESYFGALDLNLTPPLTPIPYKLTYESAGDARIGFRIAVALSDEPPAKRLFDLIDKLGAYGFVAAQRQQDEDGNG